MMSNAASSKIVTTLIDADNNKAQKQPLATQNWKIVWRNVISLSYLHLGALYGIYLLLTVTKWQTTLFSFFLAELNGLGITAGAHKLWSHKSYKATWPMRLFLCVFQTSAFQNHIYEWARDHRVHHKFTDTDADPHNSKRGFFFSHVGWLMVRKHKDVMEKGASVDMSDLEADPIVMFQKRYYVPLMLLLCFIVPTIIPCYFWGEQLYVSWHVAGVLRYIVAVNAVWCINSVAHTWGAKPYDKSISSADNTVFTRIFGDGCHNFHHVFPWDYRSTDINPGGMNISNHLIHLFASIGMAYDLRTVSSEVIEQRAMCTGDGSHRLFKGKTKVVQDDSHDDIHLWGWDDMDMTKDEKLLANILHTKID